MINFILTCIESYPYSFIILLDKHAPIYVYKESLSHKGQSRNKSDIGQGAANLKRFISKKKKKEHCKLGQGTEWTKFIYAIQQT